MRALFDIDTKDYDPKGPAFVRPSVRGIILRDGKVAMVHSLKYDYYKFPGGGIEAGETRPQALIREVLEESGLQVRPESIREYGLVHRVQKSDQPGIAMFVQDNSATFSRKCKASTWMITKPRSISPWNLLRRRPPFRQTASPTTAPRTRICWNGRPRCWKF